jgi:integrase
MEGSVYRNPENNGGGWRLQWDEPGMGKRRRRTKVFRGTKRDAEKLMRDILSSIDKKEYISPDKQTLGEYLNSYLETRLLHKELEAKSQDSLRDHLHHIYKRDIQHVPLQSLTTEHIQIVVNELIKAGRKAKSIKNFRDSLRVALNAAVDDNKIPSNPIQKVKIPPKDDSEIPIWSLGHMDIYLEKSSKDTPSPYLDAFGLILWTGLRRGELCGLKWSAVDLDNSALYVVNNRQEKRGGGYVDKAPKTKASRRPISLSPGCVDFLRRILNEQEHYRLENPTIDLVWPDDPYVICNPDGSIFGPHVLNRHFTAMCKRYKLPHTTPHRLRHTHASLLYAGGANMKELAQRLGHKSVATTMDIYTHLFEDPMLGSEKLQQLDKMLRGVEGLDDLL